MSIQIGHITIDNPNTVEFDGRTIRLGGWMSGVSRAAVSATRDALLGYVNNPDEPSIPIVWADDPYVDGMYQGVTASVSPVVGVSEKGTFDVQYTVTGSVLSRQIAVEAVTVGGFRTNGAGTSYDTPAEVTPFLCVPDACVDYWDGILTSIGAGFLNTTRTTSTGDVAFVPFGVHTAIGRRVASYAMPIGNWYTGASLIERNVGGTYIPVTGRNMTGGLSASLGWRISNGLIRVSESATSECTFTVEVYDGSSWTSVEWKFGSGGFWMEDLYTVTILRNSPECCILRLSSLPGHAGTGYDYPCLIDVRMVRGSRFVEIYMTSIPRPSTTWGSEVNPDSTSTALSSGGNNYGATRNGFTSSRKWYLFSDVDLTVSGTTSNVDISSGSGKSWSVAVGSQISSLSSTSYETLTELWQQYLAPVAVRQRVVAR